MRVRPLGAVAMDVDGTFRASGGESRIVRSVATDSRTVEPGSLFVALGGERQDGHRFVADAARRGAVGALVRSGAAVADADPAGLVDVDDPGRALLDLARAERSALRAVVVGVTGSTGKTTTKDFIGAVLGRRYRTVASLASFNNEVGLPLTLLRADAETDVLVCEMGARGAGHIRALCAVARPSIGVVTNVGVAHMELFGSPEVLRAAKAELPEALPPDGWAVLNADDAVVRAYAGRTRAQTLLFGTSAEATVRAEDVSIDRRTGRATFDLVIGSDRSRVLLPVPGEHMVPNALAAAAVGSILDVGIGETADALGGAEMSAGRMQVLDGAAGVRIVDDAYNANPTSMGAALRAARWMAGDGRCIAVLGAMAELGPIEEDEHLRIGELVARLGIDELVTVGPGAELIAVGAGREGVEPDRIHRTSDGDEAVDVVRTLLRPGDVVLVKASRVARLERVARRLADVDDGKTGATRTAKGIVA